MSNKYGDFGGTTAGMDDRQWNYPTIGYNSSTGKFYIGDDQVESVKMVAIKPRQCKEVEQGDGSKIRYPIYTAKTKMATGDVTYRLQMLVVHNGEIYNFGMTKQTPNLGWMNPRSGQHRKNGFGTGIWLELEDHIKKVKDEDSIVLGPLCWEFTINKSNDFLTVGSGKTSKVYPFVMTGEFEYVGAGRATEYDELYKTEDLEGWAKEWGVVEVEEAEDMVDPRDEQGEAPNPVMVTDETEEDQIPF